MGAPGSLVPGDGAESMFLGRGYVPEEGGPGSVDPGNEEWGPADGLKTSGKG